MPGPLSSPDGSAASKSSVPGGTSRTTVRWVNAVAPPGAVATAVTEAVPGGTGSSTENVPSDAAAVVTEVEAPVPSTLIAVTSTVAPGSVVPLTVVVAPTTLLFAGVTRVIVVPAWVCVM